MVTIFVCGFVFLNGITLDCNVTVSVVVIDTDLADEGVDFMSPVSGLEYFFDTLTTTGPSSCLEFQLVDDMNFEGNHVFTVSVSSTTPPGISTGATTIITIIDDDVTVKMVTEDMTVSENEGVTISICAEGVDKEMLELPVTVRMMITGDATLPQDIMTLEAADTDGNFSVTFNVGEAAPACLNITVVDDDCFEGDHQFTVTLVNPSPSLIQIDPDNDVTVTITDVEDATIGFADDDLMMMVEEGTNVAFDVVLSTPGSPAGQLKVMIDFTLTLVDGDKAEFDTDFDQVMLNAMFAVDASNGSISTSESVSIIADNALEGAHSFTVTLSAPEAMNEGYTLDITRAVLTVIITDSSDLAAFNFDFSPVQNPVEDMVTIFVCGFVFLNGITLDCNVTVSVVVIDTDLADEGLDFISPMSADLEYFFDTSTTTGPSDCLQFQIVEDMDVEGNHEFTVSVSSATPPGISTDASAIITILDDDGFNVIAKRNAPPYNLLETEITVVKVEFEMGSYEVAEGNSVDVCVQLVSGDLQRDAKVLIESSVWKNKAKGGGRDFKDLFAIIKLNETVSRGCASLETIDDSIYEKDEMLSLQLYSVDGTVSISKPGKALVTILDDDPVVAVILGPQDVCEGVGEITFTATIVSPFERKVLASVKTVHVTTDDFDYIPEYLEFAFENKDKNEKSFTVTIIDDDNSEPLKRFNLSLDSSNERVEIQNHASVLLYDDDAVEFSFTGNTPHSNGKTLEVNFTMEGCANVSCSTDDSKEFDCSPPEGLGTNFISIVDGSSRKTSQSLIVQLEPFCGQESQTITRLFRYDNNQCSAHLINKGVTMDGNNATIEWEGTGPEADGGATVDQFECVLDGHIKLDPCSSPLVLTGLSNGSHDVLITPDAKPGCLRQNFGRRVTFEIELIV